MKYSLEISPEAEADISQAYSWYETQQVGLGRRFLASLDNVFERISNSPEIHAATYRSVRQTLTHKFPYIVCYLFEANKIDVIAVFHGNRDPKSWQIRVKP
jgi:plasmid stabilization system protein ParE